MTEEKAIERYGKFLAIVRRLQQLPLTSPPKIEDLRLSNAELQQLYRAIRSDKFDGTLIEYLCFISASFLFSSLDNVDLGRTAYRSAFTKSIINDIPNAVCIFHLYRINQDWLDNVVESKVKNVSERFHISFYIQSLTIVAKIIETKHSVDSPTIKEASTYFHDYTEMNDFVLSFMRFRNIEAPVQGANSE